MLWLGSGVNMTHEQAHKILDRVKDGTAYSRKIIDEALWLTGDIGSHEAVRSEGMEAAICPESAIFGKGESSELVAASQSRHSSDSWPGWSRYLDRRNEQATT